MRTEASSSKPQKPKHRSQSDVPTRKDLEMTNGEDTSSILKRISNSSQNLKQSKSHQELSQQVHNVRLLTKNLSKTTVKLDVKNILIVTKARDNSLVYLTREMTEWLLLNFKNTNVYVDYHLQRSKRFNPQTLVKEVPRAEKALKYWDKKFINDNSSIIDLVITLGGDGTVLFTSSLFQRSVPPVMSFSLGSLGFLTTFQYEEFRETLKIVIEKGIRTNLRMRLSCRVHKADGTLVCEQQALNEVTIDRGPSPFVSMLELYGDGNLLTVAQADGLIMATPTGSTAYSLSAGGSLVHPNVSAISVTPICPHTLSFRPILLPDSMVLKVKVPKRSRSTAWAAFDGRSRVELQKGDYVTISASPFSMPTVMSSPTEYFDSVSRTLNWNVREQQKSSVHLLSQKNKRNYEVNQLARPKFKLMDSSSDSDESNEDGEGKKNNQPSEHEDTDSYLDPDNESDDIDDNDLSTYYMPPPGQGIDTPPVAKSHATTPTLSPGFKAVDISGLSLDAFKRKGSHSKA